MHKNVISDNFAVNIKSKQKLDYDHDNLVLKVDPKQPRIGNYVHNFFLRPMLIRDYLERKDYLKVLKKFHVKQMQDVYGEQHHIDHHDSNIHEKDHNVHEIKDSTMETQEKDHNVHEIKDSTMETQENISSCIENQVSNEKDLNEPDLITNDVEVNEKTIIEQDLITKGYEIDEQEHIEDYMVEASLEFEGSHDNENSIDHEIDNEASGESDKKFRISRHPTIKMDVIFEFEEDLG